MSVPEIKDLKSVVQPHLEGGELQSYSARYLTKPGDNYGSCMLAIAAKIKRPNGLIEDLPLIAKLPPVTNDLYWQIFQPERTCLTENKMYELVPQIHQLQLEAGLPKDKLFDGLPGYYGSRISLDPNATKVDRDAVLVQENLQVSGYRAGNRHKMFDFAHAKLVLVYMAQYHALPIALRIKKSELFERSIRPYFNRFNMNTTMGDEMKEEMRKEIREDLQLATNNNEDAVNEALERFEAYDEWLEQPEAADGLYTSLVHCDLWINNIMFKYDDNDQPTKLKFVDFQVAQYESFVHDIIFFLFSSVDSAVLEDNFDSFLRIYYDAFIDNLEEVKINTDEYSFDGFLNEVRRVGPIEIPHPIFMTKVILLDNSTLPEDFKDVDMSILSKNRGLKTITQRIEDILRLAKKFKLM
uniref:Calcium and calcium/calmodulin-dependent serine/threonine-protein kinase n=1 Tax=Zeugodacus cucurbitae TaxID=28588 RepID=A0A0A1WUS5_ZEUCU